ncbi:hypothetical protein CRE_17727 [Caenorhabditis remanei]|uniref:Uncharacterized protein n=1 Tax=Caenorhabditis remanei TaxID=31234 RepID=E3NNP8_CAERE|nr:hypothetical protein CRE_17727 [Caenorhabditis remanei]
MSHSGRPRLDIDDDITDVLRDEPRSSVREVSSHTGPSFATIFRHQKESGRTAEYGQVISHELADSQLKLKKMGSLCIPYSKKQGVLDNDDPLTNQKREMHEKK